SPPPSPASVHCLLSSNPCASSAGGNDESDFPELQTAREFSEDEEEETSQDWGTPRELTFSYITFAGGPDAIPPSEPGPRGRRDSLARRVRGPLPRPETCETLVPMLDDSLENIPSLCQSPEGEQGLPAGQCQGLEPFSAWDAPLSYADEPRLCWGEGKGGGWGDGRGLCWGEGKWLGDGGGALLGKGREVVGGREEGSVGKGREVVGGMEEGSVRGKGREVVGGMEEGSVGGK
uniref:Uncharacterized protein n=1 Tax=Gopherus evgoodei TaxID=1825980 RepID=A0A8C4Y5K2_9SAUR